MERIEIRGALEPGVSEQQTDQMQTERLQLIVPSAIHSTYRKDQRAWLMNVSDFVKLVQERQAA